MKVIKSSRIVMFDVDETLVIWDWRAIDPEGKNLISISNPAGACQELVMPHDRHITLMRQFKARGHTVVVWSQGGWAWSESVVKALGIEELVDLIIDKPSWYVDDLPSEVFMKSPIYLDPLDPLKDKKWGLKDEDDK
jgi:hypothetical protein